MKTIQLYKAASVRRTYSFVKGADQYIPITQQVNLRADRLIGPRGGLGAWVCRAADSIYSLSDGTSTAADVRREFEIDNIADGLRTQGWLDDRAEADRLSQVHADARKACHPAAGSQEQRMRERLAAAEVAVRAARLQEVKPINPL